MTLENKICELVEQFIANKQLQEEVSFHISQKTIHIAWKHYFIDLNNYICTIHSNDIRHIKKEHGDEVYHICKIPDYLEKFASIERSSTRDRKTGRNIPCLVFQKRSDNKKIKMVKVNLSRKKVLRLKTLFEV